MTRQKQINKILKHFKTFWITNPGLSFGKAVSAVAQHNKERFSEYVNPAEVTDEYLLEKLEEDMKYKINKLMCPRCDYPLRLNNWHSLKVKSLHCLNCNSTSPMSKEYSDAYTEMCEKALKDKV
jgi:hypothetical protein